MGLLEVSLGLIQHNCSSESTAWVFSAMCDLKETKIYIINIFKFHKCHKIVMEQNSANKGDLWKGPP